MNKGTMLLVVSGLTVITCCIFSQLFIKFSKLSKLKLNKLYSRKKYHKTRMIQKYLEEQLEVA
eukprot:CAMPEP_0170559560 /NCGR_PEP_ID=MMETSP0211-20121228/43631_1 /TAXON_ID=311385 /ORGANISM="Pseudokeronopsis sp., Strain OXSARD2" /LENGTH=62 /DNA_ID=CAMNT_0010872735 /DNA_START=351 /DNA_END=539 /DNA_ORIENTATION=-